MLCCYVVFQSPLVSEFLVADGALECLGHIVTSDQVWAKIVLIVEAFTAYVADVWKARCCHPSGIATAAIGAGKRKNRNKLRLDNRRSNSHHTRKISLQERAERIRCNVRTARPQVLVNRKDNTEEHQSKLTMIRQASSPATKTQEYAVGQTATNAHAGDIK